MARKSGIPNFTWSLVLAICGFILVMFTTSLHGAGVSPDSLSYLSAAESFATDRSFIQYSGHTMTNYPPLYPAILGCYLFFGFASALSFSASLNAFVFAAGIFFSTFLPSAKPDRSDSRVYPLLMLFSFPFYKVSTMTWSEPLFMLLLIVLLIVLNRYFSRPSFKNITWVALCLACLCLQRYAGIILALAVSLSIPVQKRRSSSTNILHAAACLAIALLPVSLWMLRNHYVSPVYHADLNIMSTIGPATLLHNIQACFDELFKQVHDVTLVCLIAGIVVTAGGFALYYALKNRKQLALPSTFTVSLLVCCITYSLFTLSCITLAPAETARYLFVLYAPFTVFFVHVVQLLLPRWLIPLTIGLCVVQGAAIAMNTRNALQEGAGGYNKDRWLKSELALFLQSHHLEGNRSSNAPDLYYFLTKETCDLTPKAGEKMMQQSGYVIWFDDIRNRHYLQALNQLSTALPLDTVISLQGGKVYRLR